MPVQSQAQARYLNSRFGHQWVKEHHFDQPWHNLPKYKAQGGMSQVRNPSRHSFQPNRGSLLFRQRLGLLRPTRHRAHHRFP